MDLIATIALIGTFQGIFLAISLLLSYNKPQKSYSKIFLGLLILFFSFHNLDSVLTYTREFYNFPHLFAIKDPLILLYGPLIFFYVYCITNPDFKPKWIHLLHLIPYLYYLQRIFPLYLKSAAYKIKVLDFMYEQYTNVRDVEINLIINAHIFVYLLTTICYLIWFIFKNKHPKNKFAIRNQRFLLVIIGFGFVVFVVSITRFILSFNAETVLWVPLIISVGFFIIAYRSLSFDKALALYPSVSINQNIPKHIKIIQLLDQNIEKEKVFLDKNISLDLLAKKLNTNRQYLSEAINTIKDCSFIDYINELRVAEAKKLLTSKGQQNFSLEKIAHDAGFNSLSSFNRAFKKFSGISAAKYRAENKVN